MIWFLDLYGNLTRIDNNGINASKSFCWSCHQGPAEFPTFLSIHSITLQGVYWFYLRCFPVPGRDGAHDSVSWAKSKFLQHHQYRGALWIAAAAQLTRHIFERKVHLFVAKHSCLLRPLQKSLLQAKVRNWSIGFRNHRVLKQRRIQELKCVLSRLRCFLWLLFLSHWHEKAIEWKPSRDAKSL